ncbi:hypothetical protein ZIOFF_013643 [Zingiber officinale]|uniref:Myb/SANT-like domain-containing protein n=1 Tax=Zingiber officinale TaxID=94328 RepID=A0A8J5HUN0_ZINOF|nr:hypothetical protein ZIOFF_013643 [Zingiber officinale]
MGGHNPGIDIEKYEWSKTNVAMFVEIIYDKVKQNKLQTSTFSNVVWEEINKELYQATKTNYGVDRLKGKWNRLRTRQRLFAALLAHTGVTMDPDTGKVNAPEEVWAEFYMKNKREYKSIRKEGCDHFHILSEVFGGTTATGDMHRASTQLPPTSDEERELEEAFINRGVNSYVEVVDDENEDVGGEPNNRRRRVAESSNSRRRKDPKHSRIEKFSVRNLICSGLYLIVLFTVLVIATRGFDELLLMIRRSPTRKSKQHEHESRFVMTYFSRV